MALEVVGKIIKYLPVVTGQGNKGQWSKQDFVLETQGEYPKTICITDFNDKANAIGFGKGAVVKVQIELSSREYNGKYFHDIRAWKMESADGQAPRTKAPAAPQQQQRRQPAPTFTERFEDDGEDGLPF